MDIAFVDAPNPASGPIPDDVAPHFSGPYYEWWNAKKDPESGIWIYENAEITLSFLRDFVRLHGPFDGLMGFSQGAATAALLAGSLKCSVRGEEDVMGQEKGPQCSNVNKLSVEEKERVSERDPQSTMSKDGQTATETSELPWPWTSLLSQGSCSNIQDPFLFLFAGIRVRDPRLTKLYASLRDVRSCHVIGDKDPVKVLTNMLIDCFDSPVVIRHSRGHVIPTLRGTELETLKAFLESQSQARSAL